MGLGNMNVGPIQVFSSLGNLEKLPDVVKYLSSFSQQVASQFNNLLSNRMLSGVISSSGTVVIGENFGATFLGTATNLYYIKFGTPFTQRPSVLVSSETTVVAFGTSVSVLGFAVSVTAGTPFSFLVRGG